MSKKQFVVEMSSSLAKALLEQGYKIKEYVENDDDGGGDFLLKIYDIEWDEEEVYYSEGGGDALPKEVIINPLDEGISALADDMWRECGDYLFSEFGWPPKTFEYEWVKA